MTLADIENMTLADLKAKRDELTIAVEGDPALASRYVQARTDAKARDAKLAEQAGTLAALTQGLAAAAEKADGLAARLKAAEAERDGLNMRLVEKDGLLAGAWDDVKKVREEADAREAACRDRVRELEAALVDAVALAKRRRAVLADLMARVSPLLAEEG